MTSVTSTSPQTIRSVVPTSPVPKPTLQELPDVLQQWIFNFLSMKEIAQSLHVVQKIWRSVTRNDGSLDLSSTKVTFIAFLNIIKAHHNNSHSLRSMRADYCPNLSGNRVCEVSQDFTSLTKIRVPSDTSNKGLQYLIKCQSTSLNHLSLAYCNSVTDDGLKELGQRKFPLKYLNLQSCNKITNQGIASIATLPLTYLDIGWCSRIDDTALGLLSKCALTTLKMSNCQRITDIGMGYLSKMQLKRLDLSFCTWITNEGFRNLNKMPLKYLRLDSTSISDEGLLSLELPFLKDLDIGECRNITDKGLKGLDRFPVETLRISGNKHWTNDVADALSALNITSLVMPSSNINTTQMTKLSKLPLRYLNMRCSWNLEGHEQILLQFPTLTTLELTPSKYTSQRQTIAFLAGCYIKSRNLLGEQIPASPFSLPVGMLYETILEYLESTKVS